MDLANLRMLVHELLNKYPDIVPQKVSLIILDSKSSVFIASNDKDTKHTRHIVRIVHFVNNGENFKIHKIDWCEGGLQLIDIATKNFGENYLNTIMKYTMVRLGR